MSHHRCYIVSSPSGFQDLRPENSETSAVVSPIGAVMFFSCEETVRIGLPGLWIKHRSGPRPRAIMHDRVNAASRRPSTSHAHLRQLLRQLHMGTRAPILCQLRMRILRLTDL